MATWGLKKVTCPDRQKKLWHLMDLGELESSILEGSQPSVGGWVGALTRTSGASVTVIGMSQAGKSYNRSEDI